MPLFWFVSFANRFRRIRDKTFCFDVWLEPNPCTWHTSCIQGAGYNSKELRDSYVWSPSFVAWEMSNDRFTVPEPVLPLVSKCRVTTYPKVTKKEKKKKNKQGYSYELTQQKANEYSLCGVHLGLLPQTSLGDLFILSSSLLSLPFLVRLLPRVDLGLFLYHYLYHFLSCLHVQLLEDMCTSSLDS